MIYEIWCETELVVCTNVRLYFLLHDNANCVGIEVHYQRLDLHYDFCCLLFADWLAREGSKNCVTSVLKLAITIALNALNKLSARLLPRIDWWLDDLKLDFALVTCLPYNNEPSLLRLTQRSDETFEWISHHDAIGRNFLWHVAAKFRNLLSTQAQNYSRLQKKKLSFSITHPQWLFLLSLHSSAHCSRHICR